MQELQMKWNQLKLEEERAEVEEVLVQRLVRIDAPCSSACGVSALSLLSLLVFCRVYREGTALTSFVEKEANCGASGECSNRWL